jgi:single-strand DNA-binding protein
VWSKLAEVCGNKLVKGRRISVEGRIQVRSYDAQDGSKRYVTEIVANEVEFLDSKGAAPQAGGFGAPAPAAPAAPSDGFGPSIPDEEIPF